MQSENPNNQWQQRIASTSTDVDYSCSFTLLFSVSGLSHYMPFYPHIIFVRHSAEHLYMFFPRDKKIFANESKIGNISANLTTISCWESCMAELIIFSHFSRQDNFFYAFLQTAFKKHHTPLLHQYSMFVSLKSFQQKFTTNH